MCARPSTLALQGVTDAAVYTNTNTWAQQDVTEPKHTSPNSWNLPACQLIIANNGGKGPVSTGKKWKNMLPKKQTNQQWYDGISAHGCDYDSLYDVPHAAN